MSEQMTIGADLGAFDALRILDAAAEAAREVPDGYALREAVDCAIEALRGERATHDTEIDDLRRRLASIARDASEALPSGVGPGFNVSSYHAMARALDRIAAVASIGAEEGVA